MDRRSLISSLLAIVSTISTVAAVADDATPLPIVEAHIHSRVVGGVTALEPRGPGPEPWIFALAYAAEDGEGGGIRVRVCPNPLSCQDYAGPLASSQIRAVGGHFYVDASIPGLGIVDAHFVGASYDLIEAGCDDVRVRARFTVTQVEVDFGAVVSGSTFGPWTVARGGCAVMAASTGLTTAVLI